MHKHSLQKRRGGIRQIQQEKGQPGQRSQDSHQGGYAQVQLGQQQDQHYDPPGHSKQQGYQQNAQQLLEILRPAQIVCFVSLNQAWKSLNLNNAVSSEEGFNVSLELDIH